MRYHCNLKLCVDIKHTFKTFSAEIRSCALARVLTDASSKMGGNLNILPILSVWLI